MRTTTRMAVLAGLSLFIVAMAACVPSPSATATCPEGWDQVTEYRLYFGRSDATGDPTAVSDEEWEQFMDDTVTPRFPDGLTVLDGAGQWRNSEGVVLKEQSKALLLLVWPDDEAQARLNELSDEYKRRFAQESVLLTSAPSCANFR